MRHVLTNGHASALVSNYYYNYLFCSPTCGHLLWLAGRCPFVGVCLPAELHGMRLSSLMHCDSTEGTTQCLRTIGADATCRMRLKGASQGAQAGVFISDVVFTVEAATPDLLTDDVSISVLSAGRLLLHILC